MATTRRVVCFNTTVLLCCSRDFSERSTQSSPHIFHQSHHIFHSKWFISLPCCYLLRDKEGNPRLIFTIKVVKTGSHVRKCKLKMELVISGLLLLQKRKNLKSRSASHRESGRNNKNRSVLLRLKKMNRTTESLFKSTKPKPLLQMWAMQHNSLAVSCLRLD